MYIKNSFLLKKDYTISVWYLGEFSKDDLAHYLLQNFDIKNSVILDKREDSEFVEKNGCKMIKLEYNTVSTDAEEVVNAPQS